jgi:hypothetical protein
LFRFCYGLELLPPGVLSGLCEPAKLCAPPPSQTGPSSRMSRAFICELIMQWQSATAVRRRAASDRISPSRSSGAGASLCSKTISAPSLRKQCELERSRKFMLLAVRIARLLFFMLRARRSLRAHRTRGEQPSHPLVNFSPDRLRRAPETLLQRAIVLYLRSANRECRAGVLCVNRAGIVPCSRATTAHAWCSILLLSKRFGTIPAVMEMEGVERARNLGHQLAIDSGAGQVQKRCAQILAFFERPRWVNCGSSPARSIGSGSTDDCQPSVRNRFLPAAHATRGIHPDIEYWRPHSSALR